MDVFKLDDSACAVVLPATSSTASSPDGKISSDSLSFDSHSDFFYDNSIKKEFDDEKQSCFYEPMTADAIYTKVYGLPPYPGSDPSQPGKNADSVMLCETKAELPESSSSPPAHKGKPGRHRSNNGQEQNSFTAADSNSGNTPSKSFVPCKVCGDKASGYHYGVTSCEGCKGFFRRSIQKQIEYRCLRDGKCLVIRLNRNRCQYCRFKKCLAVGMSRDSVRYGRVPKRSRERGEDNRVTQSEADQSAREVENKQLAMYDIILTISQAHHANCAYTEEKTRGIIRKPAIFSLDDFQSSPVDGSPSSVTADSLEHQKIVMWQHFAVLVTPSIQRVVEFAKRIPGFLDLTQDDQLIMIKTGFFEIWLIHVSRMISTLDNTLTFSDGSYITRQQMELMFDYEFVSGIFNFMVMFNNLQLNDTEIGIFGAIVLLQSERSGIYDSKAIDHNQEKLMEALKLQVGRNHPSDMHIYPTLMANISELRSLGTKHADHLQWFRANWTRLKLPPLFAEIFDIPKSEDEFIH